MHRCALKWESLNSSSVNQLKTNFIFNSTKLVDVVNKFILSISTSLSFPFHPESANRRKKKNLENPSSSSSEQRQSMSFFVPLQLPSYSHPRMTLEPFSIYHFRKTSTLSSVRNLCWHALVWLWHRLKPAKWNFFISFRHFTDLRAKRATFTFKNTQLVCM